MRKWMSIALLLVMLALGAGGGFAQDTPAIQATTPGSSVQIFLVICSDKAVVNLSGTILTGNDVFYQVFGGAGGTGSALTSLRQVQVDGNFAFSEEVKYNEGSSVSGSSIGSVRVIVARESNRNSIEFEATADDVQDGCAAPQNPLGTSLDTGGTTAQQQATATPTFNNIVIPSGGVLNPNLKPEPAVVIGARLSDKFRSETPALIWAQCDDFESANPGIVYDTDNIVIFWSWFAKDAQLIRDHELNAIYSVRLNTLLLDQVNLNGPVPINNDLYMFYTADLGNLRPGHYEVEYRLTWHFPISDGYAEFGPGTANEIDAGNCNFDVIANRSRPKDKPYNEIYFPTEGPVHDLSPQF